MILFFSSLPSLPPHVSWFEPPIVCRFETQDEFAEMKRYDEEELRKKRRDDDDFDEIEEDVQVAQPPKPQSAQKRPPKERDIKVVEDFNLLDIPRNVNLKPLLEDFVMPMIPDGYSIKYQAKKTTAYQSAYKKSCYTDRIYSIDDIVYQTRVPRSLFPNCRSRKILKVVKQRARAHDTLLLSSSSGHEPSSDEDYDESTLSLDSAPSLKIAIYMFSKFMRDLEDLIDMAMPTLEKKLAEMSSNLSMAAKEASEKAVNRKDSGFSLAKTNSKSVLEDTSDDSDVESETDDDDEEGAEMARNTLIDSIVKDANMRRCAGRWSTRDIHDTKFNEDKLTIQFRTGRLGLFALASNRYSNFPFQSWDIKPDFKTYVRRWMCV
jgi:cancer susceptibility candidate protein 1